MLPFIDNVIERKLKRALHKKRQHIIKNTLREFKKKHPDADTSELHKKLLAEARRIYKIVDRSILRERIQRARYTFWATAVAGVLLVGLISGFTGGSALPFIAPPITALVAWLATVATIPISYQQRVKGAMDSVVAAHEDTLLHPPQTNELLTQELIKLLSALPVNQPIDIHLRAQPAERDTTYRTIHLRLFNRAEENELNQKLSPVSGDNLCNNLCVEMYSPAP